MLAGVSGLRGVSGTRIAEGHLRVAAGYDGKASTDEGVENAKAK